MKESKKHISEIIFDIFFMFWIAMTSVVVASLIEIVSSARLYLLSCIVIILIIAFREAK